MNASKILANFFSAFFLSLSGATLAGAGMEGVVYALLVAAVVGGVAATNEWKKEEDTTPAEPGKMSLAALVLPFP